MKSIKDAKIANKKVLLRVDFNLSTNEKGEITDDTRIRQSMPTIDYLLSNKNRLILVSHFGRPKDRESTFSLKNVAVHLQNLYKDYKIVLVDDFLSNEGKELVENQKEDEIILLENIRFYPQEKENDPEFAKSLADLAEIFVNDAFAVCHRSHASTVGVTSFLPAFAGLLLTDEINMISKVFKNPKRPVVAILGGAKISTKIGLIERLMDLTENIILGGGLANSLLKVKDINIGRSICEDDSLGEAEMLIIESEKKRDSLSLPTDAIVGNPDDRSTAGENKNLNELEDDSYILDIGRQSQKKFAGLIAKAKTIIWNGPVGLFENPQYRSGTDAIYDAIVKNNDAVSIVGGGDTLAAIKDKKDKNRITHISTGGGAMLEFIEKGTLPGLEALKI